MNPTLSTARLIISGWIVSLIFFSCNPKVIHFTSDKARYGAYSTYEIVNYKSGQPGISAEGRELHGQIVTALQHQMTKRSYARVAHDPDLILRYELISAQRTEVTESRNPYYWSYTDYSIRTIKESVILLELTDRITGKLVWQASIDLKRYTQKNAKEEMLKDAIAKLYDTYLYRAKSNQIDESLTTNK